MLNSSLPLPYPVLREEPIDYNTSVFKAEIKVTNTAGGYKMVGDFDVNNAGIKTLIKSGDLSFAIQIQCISTWYRDVLYSNDYHFEYVIPAASVHEKVDFCPCIIAKKTIVDFQNKVTDFSEEFEGIPFIINEGEPVGIGQRQKFDAYYKKDIITKAPSIVNIKESATSSVMECFFDDNTIQVHLPKKQHEAYKANGADKNKYSIMNSIVVIPAIIQALNIIYLDEYGNGSSGCENFAWYKTLKYQLGKITKNDQNKIKKMLETPVPTAQMLIDDVSGHALNKLKGMEKQHV